MFFLCVFTGEDVSPTNALLVLGTKVGLVAPFVGSNYMIPLYTVPLMQCLGLGVVHITPLKFKMDTGYPKLQLFFCFV